ncbi:DUF6807 family protein [Saccharicrinis sp. FJH62]|uniref:DUF6807 family protein n=1 Tax=Saccharicrinis sp. FJH62 TaxID=3344657 RepID=UPI0035D3DAFB
MIQKYIVTVTVLLFFVFNPVFSQMAMQKVDGGYLVKDEGKNVAYFQFDLTGPTPTLMRNDFLHPVYLPDGTVMTENAPEDHLHHRGIFWAWHQILIGSESVSDSWDLKDFKTDIKRVKFRSLKDGDGRLRTKAFWLSPNYKNSKRPYLREKVSYVFHPQKENYRIIDFIIHLTPLVDSLQLGGSDDVKGYGGFSTQIVLPDDVQFYSSNGKVEPENEAIEAGYYMNITGSFAKDGTAPGGIFIYANPENQPGPQTWILRDKMSMQNAVFPGRKPVLLQKRKPLVLKYSLVLYTGEADVDEILNEMEKTDRKD